MHANPDRSRTPVDQPAKDAARIYKSVGRKIVEARLERLWRAIGVDGRAVHLRTLEVRFADAATAGFKHEYFDELRDLSEYRLDTSFIDELVERESNQLAQRLAEDVLMRESMRKEGFEVPVPRS